jgi:hypothetical protein
VNSFLTEGFVKAFRNLPEPIRRKARKNYRLWREDPTHPGLEFKRVKTTRRNVYSVRVGIGWRAVGVLDDAVDGIVWFWIGAHSEYDKLLRRL